MKCVVYAALQFKNRLRIGIPSERFYTFVLDHGVERRNQNPDDGENCYGEGKRESVLLACRTHFS